MMGYGGGLGWRLSHRRPLGSVPAGCKEVLLGDFCDFSLKITHLNSLYKYLNSQNLKTVRPILDLIKITHQFRIESILKSCLNVLNLK